MFVILKIIDAKAKKKPFDTAVILGGCRKLLQELLLKIKVEV